MCGFVGHRVECEGMLVCMALSAPMLRMPGADLNARGVSGLIIVLCGVFAVAGVSYIPALVCQTLSAVLAASSAPSL